MTKWTPEAVRRRLADAVALIEATETRPGPKSPRSAWPAMKLESIDLWHQAGSEDLAGLRNRWRIGATSEQIDAADRALGWLKLVRYDDRRRALGLWLSGKVRGIAFREACRQAGIAYRTAIRHRDEAVAAIVDSLNKTQNRVK